MKMNERNRRMAIARSKEYLQDKERLGKVLMGKWKDPAFDYEELCKKWDVSLFPLCRDDAGLEPWMLQRKGIELVTLEEWAHISCGLEKYEKAHLPFMVTRGDCLFVHLQIDLSRSEKDLARTFSQMVKAWKELYGPKETNKKAKKTKCDPWEIYDLHKSGLSLLSIARRLTGKKYSKGQKTPAYREKLWPPYKRVQRAYNQAEEMITAVEEDAHRKMIDLKSFSYGPRRLDPSIRNKLLNS